MILFQSFCRNTLVSQTTTRDDDRRHYYDNNRMFALQRSSKVIFAHDALLNLFTPISCLAHGRAVVPPTKVRPVQVYSLHSPRIPKRSHNRSPNRHSSTRPPSCCVWSAGASVADTVLTSAAKSPFLDSRDALNPVNYIL